MIGPGRVGTAIGMALVDAGYDVVAVAGRDSGGVEAFVQRISTARACTLVEAAARELVLVAVPDDALSGVVRDAAAAGAVTEGARWVHVSGGYGSEVLRPVQLAGAGIAACHPAQTFPDPDRGYAALRGSSWAVTAAPVDLGWARVLVTDLGGRPVDIPEHARTLYHAGLTVGSNATASVVTLARDLLLGAGVEDPAAFLGPLVTTSAANAADVGAQALTGPVRRGDAGTVARHIGELRAVLPEAVDAYVALSRLALSHARRAGLDPARAESVAAELEA